jgi:hypothetical protein
MHAGEQGAYTPREIRPKQPEKLPRKEQRERMDTLMKNMSQEVNKDLQENFGAEVPLINEEGRIGMDAFDVKNKGPYTAEVISKDHQEMRRREFEWSGIDNPKVRDYYIEKYHLNQQLPPEQLAELIMEKVSQEHKESPAGLMEAATTALMYKVLKSDFIIVRSSLADDYDNGVDNVMINKNTGDVICAFDEVHGAAQNDRQKEKVTKTQKAIKRGGTQIRYGIKLEKSSETPSRKKVVRAALDHVPAFYLALSQDELGQLLESLNQTSLHEAPTESELLIFDKLVASLESQAKNFEATLTPPKPPMKLSKDQMAAARQLSIFKGSLSRMKELRKKATLSTN